MDRVDEAGGILRAEDEAVVTAATAAAAAATVAVDSGSLVPKGPAPGSSASADANLESDTDICRVCRCEATPDKPLFYPCVCTGSIKYIHQECLVQWLKYSKKEFCELCKHKFSFAPIYHPDMPKRLPIKDIITGLLKNMFRAIKFWLHSTLVAISWMAIVPITACRIYRCLFAGSVSSLLTLPLDMLSTDNIISDILQGGFVVLCSLGAFISLVWLREQILSGGGPDWLENPADNQENINPPPPPPQQQQQQPPPVNNAARNPPDHVHHPLNIFQRNQQHQHQAPAGGIRLDNDAAGDNDVDRGLPPPVNEAQEPPLIPPPNQQQQQANNNNNNNNAAANDDNHWNPMEWDRAAEDLTWDRLLGLDGSLLFLEHVFWVISLNTLFILVFAFCPYHLGHYVIYGFKFQDLVEKTHFEGLVTTLVGYIMLALVFAFLYVSMAISSFHRARKVIGLSYIVIKVALLVVTEICIFPLICGVWLDICTLKLFNSTLSDRLGSFEATPGTSVFIHWLIGMIYVFYFATFVFLLREVLRPGILWFLRNLNDPDFNPVQEMIQLPVYRHIRRVLHSVTLFGFSIVLLFLLPIKIITYFTSSMSWPILPYNVSASSETLASGLSIELIWLHAILPALLEQSHMRVWAKNVVKLWTVCIAWLLDLNSFLLGGPDAAPKPPEANANRPQPNGADHNHHHHPNENAQAEAAPGPAAAAGAAAANNNNGAIQPVGQVQANPFQFNIGLAHQALLQMNIPFVEEPYTKPPHFKARVVLLIVLMCLSLLITSILTMIVPVSLGRWILFKFTGSTKLNELYTVIAGLYSIWLTIRLTTVVHNWLQIGLNNLINRQKILIVLKSTAAVFMIFGIIPVALGVLFQQIVINPIGCNHDQTPIMSICQVWALGVLITKICTAITLTGPQWWLRQVIDRIFQDGFRNINLVYIFTHLFCPVVFSLGLALSIPCIISRSIAPLFVQNEEFLILLDRRIYPVSLFLFSAIILFVFQIKQFKRLYERIRNDKYLVGQRLINFERNSQSSNKAKAD